MMSAERSFIRPIFLAFLIVAVLMFVLTNKAAAFVVINAHTVQALNSCADDKIYSVDSKDAPDIIARSFAGEGRRVVFLTCRDYDGNTHYFIRKPRPNRSGVCRIFESEIFPGAEKGFIIVDVRYDGPDWSFDMKGWTGVPPQAWISMRYTPRSSILGFVTGDPCPRGDDARYIGVENVTDGMLTTFQTYWDKITQSTDSLRAAIQNVPTISGIDMTVDATPSQKLRDGLITAVTEGHDHIRSIYCDPGGCRAFLQYQTVGFDVGPTGISLKYITRVWVA